MPLWKLTEKKQLIMNLWDKDGKTHEGTISFTCDRDRHYDERLAPYDIVGSMAHTVMLERRGIISSDEKAQLISGLSVLFAEAEKGNLQIGKEYEDIHSYVEFRLRDIAGEAAGRLNTGRSRNDQVITDIHLWLRHQSAILAAELHKLAGLFFDLSKRHESALMPGFTHMQTAMVSSFGLWFAAYAESLCDDLQLLADASSFANASPLGTAAGYGTTLAIDRKLTASLLKFDRLIVTSPYAQMSRGRTERIITNAIASVANSLGRFSSDVVLFMSPGYGFITLPDDLTTGSSIMPHKKNPDLFELIRARCNKLQSVPNEVVMMTAGLPPGYNRDYQELKAVLFDSFDEIRELVAAIQSAAKGLIIKHDIMNDGRYNDIYSVEEANKMALRGIPFRDAYRIVAGMAGSGTFEPTRLSDYTHIGSIGNTGIGLIKKRIEKIMGVFKKEYSPQELFDAIIHAESNSQYSQ
jgi:argininosuccinate lyase